MRSYLILASVVLAACTTSPASPVESYASVHDRFEAQQPTRLFAVAQPSVGSVNARRWTHDGWQDGTTDISLTDGELVAKVDASGKLAISKLAISLDPVEIPEVVFGKPAQLADVRLTLATATTADTTWADDNHATATVSLALDLNWSLAIDNTKSPLGTQHLTAIPLDLTLGGSGVHVDATLGLHADGELWSWAGLLELTQLQVQVDAETVD